MKIMKVREFKKYIISLKKYIIGFILGLSLVGGLVFAADPGSIGALFTTDSSGKWVLKGENIQNDSVSGWKLMDNTVNGIKITNNSLSGSKIIDGSLNGSKIIDESLNGNKIIDESLNGSKIADGTLSKTKLDTTLIDDIDSKLGNGDNATFQNLTVNNNISVNNDLGVTRNMWVGGDIGTKNLVVNDNTWLNGNANITGNMNATTVSINGVPLEKKIKVIDDDWIAIFSQKNVGHQATYTDYFTVPSGKYVARIRLSGSVDDGGICGVFVPEKIGFTIARATTINSLTTSNFSYSLGASWGNFVTREFDIDLLSGSNNIFNGINAYGYNVVSGTNYLQGGDQIIIRRKYVDTGGGSWITCNVEVQYGELVY